MILTSLSLLTVALEAGADYLGNYPLLVPLVKNELCRSLNQVGCAVAVDTLCSLAAVDGEDSNFRGHQPRLFPPIRGASHSFEVSTRGLLPQTYVHHQR